MSSIPYASESKEQSSHLKHDRILSALARLSSVAAAVENLRERIEHGDNRPCGVSKAEEDTESKEFSLSLLLDTAPDDIYRSCDRIDAQLNDISQLIFGG